MIMIHVIIIPLIPGIPGVGNITIISENQLNARIGIALDHSRDGLFRIRYIVRMLRQHPLFIQLKLLSSFPGRSI